MGEYEDRHFTVPADRLPIAARMRERKKKQDATVQSIFNMWSTGERSAVMIRPTGFGKTYTVAKLLQALDADGDVRFNKVLFVYPMHVIKQSLLSDIRRLNIVRSSDEPKINEKRVTFKTYAYMAKLADLRQEDVDALFGDFDLLVFDEFHCAGASKAAVGCHKVFKAAKNAVALGMTATFNRTDGVNQAMEVFDSHNVIDVYTYTDAVRDGLMPKVSYFDAIYYKALDAEGNWIPAIADRMMKASEEEFDEICTDEIIDNNISNFGDIIRNSVVTTLGKDWLDYSQRWLCLFSKVVDLEKKKAEVIISFKRAFPTKKIKVLQIDTSDNKYRHNLLLLEQKYDERGKKIYNEWLDPKPDECVVIMAINMLNMGYHAGLLTGEVIYRKTSSNIVYQQQIGRAIDINRNTPPIIIDLVGARGAIEEYNLAGYAKAKITNETADKQRSSIADAVICADAINEKSIILHENNIEYQKFADAIEKYRYRDSIQEVLDALMAGTIIDTKNLVDVCMRKRAKPRYIYKVLKDAVKQGEIEIVLKNDSLQAMRTNTTAKKTIVSFTPAMLKKLDAIFEPLM